MIKKEIKELVIARLEKMPENQKISIGSFGDFNKYELIENVKKGNKIGEKVVEIELGFLRAMKEGILV